MSRRIAFVNRETFQSECVDRARGQIKQRFLSLSSLAATFSALLPSILLDASDDELYAAAELLAKQYDTDISLSFPAQLL